MQISRRTLLATAALGALPLGRSMFGPAFSPAHAAETLNLTISSSHPLTIPWVKPLKTKIVDESNPMLADMGGAYEINWTEAFGGSLYNFNDTLEAVAQGLSDMGWIGALWEPATLPFANIMYSTPFATSTAKQAIDVMNELTAEQPAMQKEWVDANIKFLGACGSGGYHLLTKEPIDSLDDIKGMKILGVPVTAPWVEGLGATLINTGLPAMYSQLQTGVGDGVIIIATGAWPLKLYEVAPYINKVDTGGITFGGFGVNMDTWNRLPADVQTVLAKLGQAYSDENARLIEVSNELAFKTMAAEGATIIEMSQEDRVAFANSMAPLGKIWVEANAAKGLPAADILRAFMDTVRAHGGTPLRDWDKEI
ncbi:C4-dicarboxylate TRAP transporter substrate-binding protein [Breoghania sp. L-A4]|uniref:C4-dicarboxylate TRAP transporter substrate-binding protein n=1 Tax=Breoghania sp. L-A4 TaxID=2304600 RepID=UPI000E35E86F|nr:C4-dicarboxylate TRAP transporter substrate-binding protein [Breoghania sp. L-A4]AXS42550.1 C4-dicarboxylate ABC transporter substrate-binding protein [Breoghania sp. L-A4]